MFKPNIININVHSATCSCSVELYKWFTLADFFPQTGIFAGFSLHIINLAVRISAAVMAGAIILFSIYIYILFAKRNSETAIGGPWAGGGGERGGHCIFYGAE